MKSPKAGLLRNLYGGSLSLLTDLYQLTMAQGYWKTGLDRHEAIFHLYFRKNPFGGNYALACGLELVAEFIETFRFSEDDVAYLATLKAPRGDNARGTAREENGIAPVSKGKPLFEPAFLAYLRKLKLTVDVDAVPEGTAVFAPEPLLRIQGSLLQCQLIETALLNIVNFQTLIATKASRVALAAAGAPVVEFGLRRAQGIDGGVGASRAAYIGGCEATSNVLAGKLLGIPVRGTHAHSWVMAFGDELEAFQAYAESLPGDCVFLVDTYDSLDGVRQAIEVGRWLKSRGRRLAGIRLDSGDLANLSVAARAMLDLAGFPDASITASNDLDEASIDALREKGAPIGVWGVGTRLVTGHGQSALGGVYKLSAIRAPGEEWRRVIKVSQDTAKASFPGCLQVRRFLDDDRPCCDMIFDLLAPPSGPLVLVDPLKHSVRRPLTTHPFADLLAPDFRAGRRVDDAPTLEDSRTRAAHQLAALPKGMLRSTEPHEFLVGLEQGLSDTRRELMTGRSSGAGGPSRAASAAPSPGTAPEENSGRQEVVA